MCFIWRKLKKETLFLSLFLFILFLFICFCFCFCLFFVYVFVCFVLSVVAAAMHSISLHFFVVCVLCCQPIDCVLVSLFRYSFAPWVCLPCLIYTQTCSLSSGSWWHWSWSWWLWINRQINKRTNHALC